MKIKEKAKEFWEENKEAIYTVAILGGFTALVYAVGYSSALVDTDTGIRKIAAITPELTFGDFQKQVLTKTFDMSVYK